MPAEINELDWKSSLSDKSDRLAQHLSAFSNLPGGGFLVFGVYDDGSIKSVDPDEINKIVQKPGNIARNNLANPITIDHITVSYKECSILVIYINEAIAKPVHLRGGTIYDSYKRSAAPTVKMSSAEVAVMIAGSHNLSVIYAGMFRIHWLIL